MIPQNSAFSVLKSLQGMLFWVRGSAFCIKKYFARNVFHSEIPVRGDIFQGLPT